MRPDWVGSVLVMEPWIVVVPVHAVGVAVAVTVTVGLSVGVPDGAPPVGVTVGEVETVRVEVALAEKAEVGVRVGVRVLVGGLPVAVGA